MFKKIQELPERISSDEERELLALLCRVHELEADKISLQAERLARQGELRRRDLQLLRAERQRRLCEDIISTQRKLIEGKTHLIMLICLFYFILPDFVYTLDAFQMSFYDNEILC